MRRVDAWPFNFVNFPEKPAVFPAIFDKLRLFFIIKLEKEYCRKKLIVVGRIETLSTEEAAMRSK